MHVIVHKIIQFPANYRYSLCIKVHAYENKEYIKLFDFYLTVKSIKIKMQDSKCYLICYQTYKRFTRKCLRKSWVFFSFRIDYYYSSNFFKRILIWIFDNAIYKRLFLIIRKCRSFINSIWISMLLIGQFLIFNYHSNVPTIRMIIKNWKKLTLFNYLEIKQ